MSLLAVMTLDMPRTKLSSSAFSTIAAAMSSSTTLPPSVAVPTSRARSSARLPVRSHPRNASRYSGVDRIGRFTLPWVSATTIGWLTVRRSETAVISISRLSIRSSARISLASWSTSAKMRSTRSCSSAASSRDSPCAVSRIFLASATRLARVSRRLLLFIICTFWLC